MSDLPFPEGLPERPYWEPPPERVREVHWKSAATTWPTRPFSYLEGLPAKLTESYVGTASFWFRVNGTMSGENPGSPALGSSDGIPIVFVIGPRHLTEGGIDGGFYIRVRGDAEAFQVQVSLYRAIGNIQALIEPINTNFAATYSLPGNLCDNKWAHFLMWWDFSTGTGDGKLIVNKIERTIYPRSVSFDFVASFFDAKSPSEIAAPVTWGQPARFFGAHTETFEDAPPALVPANPMLADNKISLAHVWISTQHKIADVAKFVGADNKPVKLGPNGEVATIDVTTGKPTEIRPEFYFRGGPSGFVVNGSESTAVKLVGRPPIVQSIAPVIGA